MSDLVKYQKSEVSVAMEAPKIREVESSRNRVKEIYLKALLTAGQKNADPQDLSLQIDILDGKLKKHFGGVTLEEVSFAAEKGSIGEYGEFYGISPKTICGWVRSYLDSHERKIALRESKKPKALPEPKTLNRLDKQEFWNEVKEDYLKSGKIIGELALYPVGVELGHIDIKNEMVVEEAIFNAIKFFENRLEDLRIGGVMTKVLKRDLIEGLMCDVDKKRSPNRWINQCKREAVKIAMKS